MKKILLIEDDSYSAQSFAEQLADQYEVCVSRTGEDGYTDAQQISPDLILLDIILPGKMNGFDVLRELKQNSKTDSIPVVLLTNLDEQKAAALDAGAADCLVKANVTYKEISAVIDHALKSNKKSATPNEQ